MTHAERTARFARISTALALRSDQQLNRLVLEAEPLASGIGGTTSALEIEGIRVFAKRLRLTGLERRPENRMSTKNLFGLPTIYQRNVGSAGFGVWRELAAHVMTTGWALSRQLESFPVMYHWRVLEDASAAAAPPLAAELADVQGMVDHWGGSDAVRVRLEALADATASVVVFLEFLPWNLSAWLEQQRAAGPGAIEAACTMVDRGLTVDVPRMNALGLLHGDAHFGNILTDGTRLYLADLGLASSGRFELSTEEAHHLADNESLDRAYVLAQWVNWLVKAWSPTVSDVRERMERVRAIGQGQAVHRLVPGLPACASEIIRRHAPVATLVNDFYVQLHGGCTSADYPRRHIEAALQAAAA